MSYPIGWDLVNITGTYVGRNGVPCVGSVTLSSPQLVLRSGTIVPAADIVFDLVNGVFSGQIPATDDPNAQPSGWVYTVTENVPGGRQGYQIVAPHTSPGIDLSTVIPVTLPMPPTSGFPYVTLAQLAGTAVGDGAYLMGYQFPATGGSARTVQLRLQDRLSIKDFGAVGDGSSHPASSRFATLAAAQAVYPACTALTDELDMLAFMAARDLLQINSDFRGGLLYAPRGHYLFNRNVVFTPYDDLHNMVVLGEGMTATTFDFSSCPAATDGFSVVTQGAQFTFRDFMVTGATRDNLVLGSGATVGGGTNNSQIVVERVRSEFAGRHGLNSTNVYLASFRDCWFYSAGVNGANFNGYHTSCQFSRCESSSNAGGGYVINGMTYSGFDACGSDTNTDWGYSLSNVAGMVFKNCGAESNGREGFSLFTSTASAAGIPTIAQDIHGLVFDGCFALNNSTTAAGTYASFIGATTANSRPIEFKILGGVAGPATSSDHALILNGASGQVTCHKDLFDDAAFVAADVLSGSVELVNATVSGRRMLCDLTAPQALTTGIMTTLVLNATQVNDLGATLNGSGAIIMPRGVNKVRVTASIDFAANTAGVRQLFLQHNGANLFGLPAFAGPAAAAGDTIFTGSSCVLSVVQGDAFTMQGYHNSGSTLNVSNGFNTWLCVEAIN